MTSITIPRDDLRVLDLKLKNSTSDAVKPANAAQVYPGIAEHNPIRQQIREQFRNKGQRSKRDRRQGDRRYHNEPVLLDTRMNRDRRQQGRRKTDHRFDQELEVSVLIRKGFDGFA